MKTILPFIFFLLFITSFSNGQLGESALDLNISPITVPDNTNGSVDVNTAHTIEMWFKADEVMTDQKLYSKITGDFVNGYILGIENGTIKYEIFDAAGNKKELIAGSVSANQWTHLAATYMKGGKMKIYINGVLAGEVDDDNSDVGFNAGPLTIGTNSWNLGILNFSGEIDEVRFWHSELASETINNYMHLSANLLEHPNLNQLQLYHKYNEGTGSTVTDNSTQTNDGSFTGATWTSSTIPFKSGPLFLDTGPAIGGVWVGHESYTLANMTISGIGLTGDQSATIETNQEVTPNSFCSATIPAGIDGIICLVWDIMPQDDPTITFSYDFSNYDLTNIESFVLLEAATLNDFSGATVVSGSFTNDIFEVSSHAIPTPNANGHVFYRIGYVNTPPDAVNDLDKIIDFTISPNPSDGHFQIQIESESVENLELNVLDFSGKLIFEKQLKVVSNYQESFDLSNFPQGIYLIHLRSEKGITTRKLVIK